MQQSGNLRTLADRTQRDKSALVHQDRLVYKLMEVYLLTEDGREPLISVQARIRPPAAVQGVRWPNWRQSIHLSDVGSTKLHAKASER